jgi:hypothetical protein
VRLRIAAIFMASAGLLIGPTAVFAHHSFQAEFDESQPVTITGTVTKVTWKNPHVLLNVDVQERTGATTNWELELASPNGLLRQGWKVDSVKRGDVVTVSGFRARNNPAMASARKITVGGRTTFAGTN